MKFDEDEHPGAPRILFVGLGESSHTHAWIKLLEGSRFNVRLFALPTGIPPEDFAFRTYVTHPGFGASGPLRKPLFPLPWLSSRLVERLPVALSALRRLQASRRRQWTVAWLAKVVRKWRPHVIHTIGLDPASYLYAEAREQHGLEGLGRWVQQIWGGSDLELTRFDPDMEPKIRSTLSQADKILSDTVRNFDYLREMGIGPEKIPEMGAVPGIGGVDLSEMANDQTPPSQRRLILWPKAYESPWSKALPVLEALKLAWPDIQPCRIVMLAMTPEVRSWFRTLPKEMQDASTVDSRIRRQQVLELMRHARVMLAPSLIDGTPNSIHEAMATGALPIVSPLETIKPLVEDNKNVLFARNLYPEEIASALRRAMTDDEFVDRAARANLGVVRGFADREKVRKKVLKFYGSLAQGGYREGY